jgi:hypothetical protein
MHGKNVEVMYLHNESNRISQVRLVEFNVYIGNLDVENIERCTIMTKQIQGDHIWRIFAYWANVFRN